MNFLKHKKTGLIAFFLSAMILFASNILMGEEIDTLVSINPANQTVQPGASFSVNVYCVPGEPIKGYELTVSFDASVLQALAVTEGDIFDGFSTFFNSGIIDNTNGDISKIFGLIIGTSTVTDPGTLVHIDFIAGENIASSIIDLIDVGITNEDSYVSVSVNNGIVKVDTPVDLLIVDNSPKQGYTGDSFVFSASVTNNIEPSKNINVKVDWSHGTKGGNVSMNYISGTHFSKTVTLDKNSVADMTYEIYAVDSFGNSITTPTTFVPVSDNDPPTIASVSTTPSSQEIGGYVYISTKVTDNIEMGDVFLNIENPEGKTEKIDITQNKNGDVYSYNKNYNIIGTYSIYIQAYDVNGFSATSGTYNFEIKDIIAPVISNIGIQTSNPLDTDPAFGWVKIQCKVTDNIKVDSVYLHITKPDNSYNNVSMSTTGNGIYYYNSIVDFSSCGNYNYFIWAKDNNNNMVMSNVFDFSMPPNWDINTDGTCNVFDLISIANIYGDKNLPGWIREDVDNNGAIEVMDLVLVSNHHGETW
jgi:hypothetical protein